MAKEKPDLVYGTLDMLILKALQHEPRHGLAIADRIQQISQDVLRVEQGALLPIDGGGTETARCGKRTLVADYCRNQPRSGRLIDYAAIPRLVLLPARAGAKTKPRSGNERGDTAAPRYINGAQHRCRHVTERGT